MHVKDLAVLLNAPKHPDFRSFRCKGMALDSETARIAFVFEMPAFAEMDPPKPLRTMFESSPSVTERVQLALRTTESVRYFRMAGWLHAIREHPTLFKSISTFRESSC